MKTIIGLSAAAVLTLLTACGNRATEALTFEQGLGQDTTAKVVIEKAEIIVVTDSSYMEGSRADI